MTHSEVAGRVSACLTGLEQAAEVGPHLGFGGQSEPSGSADPVAPVWFREPRSP